jgi:hypothetical protein
VPFSEVTNAGRCDQRAVINVDGALLATTLLVIALCLRSVEAPAADPWQRSLWTTVTKSDQAITSGIRASRSNAPAMQGVENAMANWVPGNGARRHYGIPGSVT